MSINKSVLDVGQKCDLTSGLNCRCQCPLVLSTNAAHTAGHDLAAFGDELTQLGSILIVNMFSLVNAELADFTPGLSGTGSHFAVFH